jgi:membrane-associated protein
MMVAQQITAFIHANSLFAGPLAFAVALLGALLGTNLIVPSGAIVSAMGVLVGAGVIEWTIVPWAACGAILGMSVSYVLGMRYGSQVRRFGLLQIWPKVMERADTLFARFGFVSILIAHFSGPLRAAIATIAGVARMPRITFELANVTAALIWASTAVCVGAVPGSIINPASYWLLAAVIIVPALMLGVSVGILFARKAVQKR